MPEGPVARATAVSVGTAETLALFIPGPTPVGPVNIDNPNVAGPQGSYLIRGSVAITSTTGTNPVIRCRRGNGTGGTQVGTSQAETSAAAASVIVPFVFSDPGNPNPQQGWSITISTTTAADTAAEIVASINDLT